MPQRYAGPEVNGARVRELRRQAGLSASDLARKIGISPQYMNQIERGKRPTVSPAMFNRIVAAMGVSRDDLSGSFVQDAA
jgi:transcriptional regulator with XRE-family HTH domain